MPTTAWKAFSRVVLPLEPPPPEDGQNLFGDVAGQAIAKQPLRERDQRFVAGEDAEQEPLPGRARRVGVVPGWAEFGDQVFAAVLPQTARPHLQGAVGAIQQPRVAVEVLGLDRNARLATGQVERRR